MEHPLFDAGMILIELPEELLRVLPLRIAVHRAFTLNDRQIILVPETDDIHLVNEHQRTDHCQVHPVKIRPGRKRVKTPLKDEREKHCLNDIVLVVRVSGKGPPARGRALPQG